MTDAATGTALEAYTYLGLATIVQRSRPETGTELTYIQQPSDTLTSTDGGDRYTGLDRFGRVIDQNWINNGSGAATDRLQYGYDADGNVLYKSNLVNAAESELYHANGAPESSSYDLLNRLTGFARGTLSVSGVNGSMPDTVSSASQSQSWTLDALGNATTVTINGTAQSRTINSRDQLTGVGGNSQSFDNNGNTTTSQNGQQYVYDAWNRLVAVKDASGNVLTSYSCDANGRRVVEAPTGATATSLYYSANWQVIEEQQGGATTSQYVWGLGYADDLVERDAGGVRLYAQQDANHNVTALVNTSGQTVERFLYDPYGQVTVLTAGWTSTLDAYSWRYLYQGGRLDLTSGLYGFRHRDYDPVVQRWIEKDPAGYVNGPNVYQAYGSSPVEHADPSGEFWGLGAAAVGGLIGGVVGAASYLVTSAITGSAITTGGLVGAAAGGAVNGAIIGLAAGALTGDPASLVVAGAVVGATAGGYGGFTQSVVQQAIDNHGDVNWSKAADAGLMGMAVGAVTGGVGGGLSSGGSALLQTSTGEAVQVGIASAIDGVALANANAAAVSAITTWYSSATGPGGSSSGSCSGGGSSKSSANGATKGMGGRVLTASEQAEFDAFAQRAQNAGLKPSPYRTGSWGTFDANGTYTEVTRIDVAEAGKPGWRGVTHMHITGQDGHLPLTTKIPGEP